MLSKSRLKYIQTLGHKKFRDRERLFIAEGPKLVEEMISSEKVVIKEIFALQEWMDLPGHDTLAVNVTGVSLAELEKISQLSTANKVVAIVQYFDEAAYPVTFPGVTLALDTIQDPGNMGTIIRLADWFGIKQVVCSEGCADLYNPKVVQATMGSIARVTVTYLQLEEWLGQQAPANIYATALEGKDISAVDRIEKGVIIIGNESKGINPLLLEMAGNKITIPRKGMAESLNAAVATGIILSHLI